jgi:hypothetical protein
VKATDYTPLCPRRWYSSIVEVQEKVKVMGEIRDNSFWRRRRETE